MDGHVFISLERRAQVKILNINAHVPCFVCTHYAVPKDLRDQVASGGDTDSIRVWLLWSEVDDNVRVGYCPILRYFLDFFVRKDEDGVGAWRIHLRIALRLVAEFLSKCVHPDFLCDGFPSQLFVAGDEFFRRRMVYWGVEVFDVW